MLFRLLLIIVTAMCTLLYVVLIASCCVRVRPRVPLRVLRITCSMRSIAVGGSGGRLGRRVACYLTVGFRVLISFLSCWCSTLSVIERLV